MEKKTRVAIFIECGAVKIGKATWALDTKLPLRHVNKSNARFNRKNPKAHSEWAVIQAEEKAVAIVSKIARKKYGTDAAKLQHADVIVHIWVFIGDLKIGKARHRAEARNKRIDCDGVKGILDGIEAGRLIENDNQVVSLHIHQSAVPGQVGDRIAVVLELASENPPPQIEGVEKLLGNS